jgi:phospholipid-transporting ATPase
MLTLSTSLTLANRYWSRKYISEYEYLEGDGSDKMQTVYAFFSFWIMTNSVMALNVEVALQIQKIIYTFWIQADAVMTYPDYFIKDINHCKVRNLKMLEELGQIDYLFCDKTGTLTKNELVFKSVSIIHEGRRLLQANIN